VRGSEDSGWIWVVEGSSNKWMRGRTEAWPGKWMQLQQVGTGALELGRASGCSGSKWALEQWSLAGQVDAAAASGHWVVARRHTSLWADWWREEGGGRRGPAAGGVPGGRRAVALL
jgi:hypothetical protein